MENLPELRDIHLPIEGVSLFPLARGWWFVLGALILSFFLIRLIKVLRRQSKKLYAKYLLNKFAKENNLASVIAMSEILRRICLKKYPDAVALSGREWSEFLLSKTTSSLTKEELLLLQTAPYRKSDSQVSPEDISALRKFCFDWVGENL